MTATTSDTAGDPDSLAPADSTEPPSGPSLTVMATYRITGRVNLCCRPHEISCRVAIA